MAWENLGFFISHAGAPPPSLYSSPGIIISISIQVSLGCGCTEKSLRRLQIHSKILIHTP